MIKENCKESYNIEMALAGINGVEKFIYMILGVELKMRMNKEHKEDDTYSQK
jgi:hypothetical protein